MHTIPTIRNEPLVADDPASEHTGIQLRPVAPILPVEAIEYHLFAPLRAHHPLLEEAYEVWRDGWMNTLHELDGVEKLHSDEFNRQDEIGVLCIAGRCIAVTGLRWLDLSLTRAREDSYFQHWPSEAIAALGHSVVGVTNNTIVHPDWRGAVVRATGASTADTKLKFATIGLSMRRFISSPAERVVALARNDRAMHLVAASMGATKLGQIQLHGIETDVLMAPREELKVRVPVVDELWARRHQA